jgi:tetraacyldisaccharide 4'-kinase
VAWLAERLISEGMKPAIVSRGYGGSAGRGPKVVTSDSKALECGDEPRMLALRAPGALVVVGSDRCRGAENARRLGADVILLDDGYQHRRLAREVDILLLDCRDPFGNGRLLPAGPLREPLVGIGRADIIVATGGDVGEPAPRMERLVRPYNAAAPIFCSGLRRTGFIDHERRPVETPARAVAFCGIARPERFRAEMQAAGIDVIAFRSFRDHHRFSPRELRELGELARANDAYLVTTEKDLARLDSTDDLRPIALRVEAEIFEEEVFLAAVTTAIETGVPCGGDPTTEHEP